MLSCQTEAINRVREYAVAKQSEHQAFVDEICKPFDVDVAVLMDQVLHRPITINFHPDRYSNNGKTIVENLIEQGEYHGQFRTGTTNGGRSAYVGGQRFSWEQRIFFGAYPNDVIDRPKYGALNLHNYLDGASVRFGSCFFVLKHEAIGRCTFAYGDSSSSPTALCTCDTFIGILAEIFREFLNKGRILNRVLDPAVTSKAEVLAILLNPCEKPKDLGRNLDYCIETHLHGDVQLGRDIERFYVDASFQNTTIGEQAEALCEKYGIILGWIPKRQIDVGSVGSFFRGPKVPELARKIDSLWGNKGVIDAELIGRASRDSVCRPEAWAKMGNESELFQYIKQLWHTVGYFG